MKIGIHFHLANTIRMRETTRFRNFSIIFHFVKFQIHLEQGSFHRIFDGIFFFYSKILPASCDIYAIFYLLLHMALDLKYLYYKIDAWPERTL